ncbi:MAG: hypothetical protein R3D00_03155 [Bacteroidia bacterium]
MKRKQIFIAPLDWGLGHATRSARLIDLLLEAGADVVAGGSGASLMLLQQQFPSIRTFTLPAYNVSYARNHWQVARILSQTPRLAGVIRAENRRLREILKTIRIDGIISDNRYGIHSPDIPSVFVCHQLHPLLPSGLKWMEPAVSRLHQAAMRHFDQIWVPDYDGSFNLSGDLSHRFPLSQNICFTGPLSRFQSLTQLPDTFGHTLLDKYPPEVLAIISGPEPQRTLFERMVERQAKEISKVIWLVRGKSDQAEVAVRGNLVSISHLPSDLLALAIARAGTLISRSGYSSLMDYHILGVTQPVLIPTPGQTEQEYLATKMQAMGQALVFSQNAFSMKDVAGSTAGFSHKYLPEIEKMQRKRIGDYLDNL